MRPTHLRSSKLRPHNSYYTGNTLSHPSLGPLHLLEDTKKNLVLGYRVNIDKFGLKESSLLKINERLSHENLLRLDGINSINLNSEHFIYLEKFDTTLDEEILYRAQRNSLFDEAEIYNILNDIGSALAYLQANQISHVQVKADSIVKVGSKYKLLDLSPFGKAKPRQLKPLAKSPLGARVNGVPASSAQENHKDNVTRLAFLALDAMTLRPDSGKPTESKLGTAAELYSEPLIKLLRKMLELNSSLRLDCATCIIYIKELYKQPISANSLVNNSFFRQKENTNISLDAEVLKKSLAKNSSKKSLKLGSPSVNNRYAPIEDKNEKYVGNNAMIKEIQDYIPTRDTRENLSLSSGGSFDENPIASEPMELDQPSSPQENYDEREPIPMSMCELKNEPISSSKQEFDKFKSPESARNPFKDMHDLMRHNSPPNTTMKDYSTDYMTTVDSPMKTRSDHLETSPPKKVESIKEAEVEEQKPEETLIFSEAYDNFHAEPKILPVPQLSVMKKPKKLPPALDYRLPTFGDDEGDDSEIDSAKFASSRGHKTPKNDLIEQAPPIPQHKPKQPSIIKETPLDISIKSGERSPLKPQPETSTEVYPDGSVYKGEVFGRMKHGIGRLTYADGSCYEGEWNQDNIEGYGVLFYANGKIGYEGEWQNNKCNGRGVMYNEQVQMGIAQEKVQTWHRYEGGFCNDKWEGEGRLVFLNGDEFCGDFVNDLIHGNGIYTYQSGESFEGEWVNNVLVQVYED